VDGHRYEFRLRPAKGTAISEVITSAVVSAIPGRRPAAPVLRTPSVDAGGQVVVSWPAVPDATTYAVSLRDATRREAWRVVVSTSRTTWSASGLVNGNTYELRVRSDNDIIVGATSRTAVVRVPLLGAVSGVRVRSPRRDRVRTTAASVPFATGYRLLVAPASSCRRTPRAGAFDTARGVLGRPVATVRTSSRALWVRWYAVRDGVVGRLSAASTACTRVR
jgi:hypothetical protein